MDSLQKVGMMVCPKLANKKILWGPRDFGYLGLGSMLYLNFMRYMAVIFVLMGVFSIPMAYVNSKGDRWTSLEAVEFAATRASIGNLGSSVWTPQGDSYCNNHGFMAEVCQKGGWGPEGTLWDYECGRATANISSTKDGGLNHKCSKKTAICKCMPGFSGDRCEAGSSATPIPGWCTPPNAWWLEKPAVRPTTQDKTARSSAYCSGHGWCEARVAEANTTDVRFTFCQCDKGWFGEDCSRSDVEQMATGGEPYRYGDFWNYAINDQYRDWCGLGNAPRIVREFIVVRFPQAMCNAHGFPVRMPTENDGRIVDLHNAYRPQTPGICMCEPGYNGEQCLGGQAVPDIEGWFAGVCTFILLFGVAFLYRQRKWMEQAFDDEHVTPSDFTVFVDELPEMRVDQVGEVVKHFEAWGPVQSVTPATDDEVLVWNQKDKNNVLETLQMYREADHNRRAMETWQRETKANGGKPLHPKPGPSSLPPLVNLVDAEALDQGVSGADSALFTFCNYTGLGPSVLSREQLFRYLLWLNTQISKEIVQPNVETFHRAFVTFQLSDSQDQCREDYSEERQGMFGKKPDHPAKCLFKGQVLKVSQAPEPEEVLWDSLDVGKRERWARGFLSFLVMCGVIVGMFELVRIINEDKSTGVIGILINVALTVINILVATFWLYVADFEQHYEYGAKMRSVYIKTLLTQLAITVMAGTLGVYGYPLDSKNGYIPDWYAEAGGFLFRQVIIEAFLPVLINYINMPYRALSWYANTFGTSKTLIDIYNRPSPYILAERCAALMRTVLLCCAFNSGLPILNFAVAFLITLRYWTDKYCMQVNFKIQKSGPELARILELTLMLAVLVNAVVGWVTLRAGWQSSFISEVIFYLAVVSVGWAILGYFSFRWCNGRDCWGGSGPIIPCSGWLCCFNEAIMRPFNIVHEAYMKFVFGQYFFGDYEDNLDETAGQTYEQLHKAHHLRKYPYVMYERSQLFPAVYDQQDPADPPMTGVQYLEHIRKKKEGMTETMAVNPLLEMEKANKLRALAAARRQEETAEILAAMESGHAKGSRAVNSSTNLLAAGARSTDSTPIVSPSAAGAAVVANPLKAGGASSEDPTSVKVTVAPPPPAPPAAPPSMPPPPPPSK